MASSEDTLTASDSILKSIPLEGIDGGPDDLDAWLIECDAQLNRLQENTKEFPVVKENSIGFVKAGRFPGIPVNSYVWTQEFTDEDGKVFKFLNDLYLSNRMGELAKIWDRTYQEYSVLKEWSPDAQLLLWKYNPSPLPAAEHLYVIGRKQVGDNTVIGYSSVSRKFAEQRLSAEVPRKKCCCGRVESKFYMPSCDRIRSLDGGKRLILDHLITTSIGGCVCDCLYNTAFRGPTIDTWFKEMELIHKLVLEQTG
eukprot:TRINITY_DN80393_c0_g1_i1.p1 TRINITY_DN80393_c0_g1~~TRINITY_DN80393_c0_g1_i1.p1  ORF type:complete len:254 (+),score=44.54 TRINITY_DN80393_c0_g1_i1:80-841(+)